MEITGTITNGHVVFDAPCNIPDGTKVTVHIEHSAATATQTTQQAVGKRLLKHAGTVTDLPVDLAEQHDHYLHGARETMSTVFADTFLWLALVHPKDAWHQRARDYLDAFAGSLVTTDWVLMEVGDALAGSEQGRCEFIALRSDLLSDPDVTVVSSDRPLLEEGVALYGARLDKQWSLTDCTSFVTMQKLGIRAALTGDHHFEQAGFVALLK